MQKDSAHVVAVTVIMVRVRVSMPVTVIMIVLLVVCMCRMCGDVIRMAVMIMITLVVPV